MSDIADPSGGSQWSDQFRLKTRPDDPETILDQREQGERPIDVALHDAHFRAVTDMWNDLLRDLRDYLLSTGPRGPEDEFHAGLVERVSVVRGQLKVWRDDWTFKT